ncbi:magnesium transporter CorA family protein [Comamonas aquatica]|jgi:Mg2+ and Co2+ transporter CorA|uniref:Magnesium transport protein CorA n=1 Tax=Comamonas aquatica TaxID=225991 RepID=A0AA35GJQ0_9BURK|nr:magnesium transporter CorA family protein [Comamonas aquatica]CAB5684693.1 Magnesium transport protein CorA [Comamonas aquatica]CAB5701111.1 Magnesium transport protein CorA [Comamonas aquatica]CAC9183062.1 Magnesium transport protein CorA [Comamonas aquatica]CAC9678152.1 Magnesium transport protein CorA [Comamonas aquatica]
MRLLLIQPATKQALDLGTWPASDAPLPAPEAGSFYWLSCERTEFETQIAAVQRLLLQLCGTPLVDLHISDLLNAQIPSTFDYTSDYDVMLFRRLDLPPPPATGSADAGARPASAPLLKNLDTAPVGFAVFDQLLFSVHPGECPVRAHHVQRLLAPGTTPEKRAGSRLPASSADLMLRQLDLMVDGFLSLRRDMAKQMDQWQMALLNPNSRFHDWGKVLQAQLGLHQLNEICEDQRAAVQDWIDMLESWPEESETAERRARELLRVRSRDVLEHIERVSHHVHRMELSAEAAVQMHFSAQSNRANDIMRTLTTLTAIFLPLNLIAAVFGMNFDVLPLVHKEDGFWWAMGAMAGIGLALLVFFLRRRYIERDTLMGENT